jgi:CheY-like chemotaxis protein
MSSEDFVVLLAEDDEHDVVAIRRAWKRLAMGRPLQIVNDGEACLDYLYRRGIYAEESQAPTPNLLLLDIHMPKLGGVETLAAIRADERFLNLPVIMLTTSKAEEDRARSYATGANAYLVKPVGFENLVGALKAINQFWALVARSETDNGKD